MGKLVTQASTGSDRAKWETQLKRNIQVGKNTNPCHKDDQQIKVTCSSHSLCGKVTNPLPYYCHLVPSWAKHVPVVPPAALQLGRASGSWGGTGQLCCLSIQVSRGNRMVKDL